jgi:hypothetical protein
MRLKLEFLGTERLNAHYFQFHYSYCRPFRIKTRPQSLFQASRKEVRTSGILLYHCTYKGKGLLLARE